MMSLWDALRMNMMISYQELVRTFLSKGALKSVAMLCQYPFIIVVTTTIPFCGEINKAAPDRVHIIQRLPIDRSSSQ